MLNVSHAAGLISKNALRNCAGAMASRRAFSLLSEAQSAEVSTPQFMVGPENGFLPRTTPMPRLPPRFQELENILNDMPLRKDDGSQGLLYDGKLGDVVKAKLPQYDVSDINDSALLAALFRDYTFLASAYLLEPCDLRNRKEGKYGLGREVLPASIAVPLVEVAKKTGAKPFMEYAMSYALFNYKKIDESKGLDAENVGLIRKFHGCDSERGFVAVHVAMVSHTGKQVTHTMDVLDAATRKDRAAFDTALINLEHTMGDINRVMDTMWGQSKSTDYMKFRTFIMGTKSQPMFPNGVVYEGVSKEPTFFRGESGANDSIIPTCDNLFELTEKMPNNPLTEILKDFRTYRPTHHSEWLTFVDNEARKAHVREFALDSAKSSVLYLANVDRVREFRARHWNFTKEYIIRHTDHPVATGGSPIITWLPNQLNAVLRVMESVADSIDNKIVTGAKLDSATQSMFETLKSRGAAQRRVLLREVESLIQRFPDQAPQLDLFK
eukprot:comp12618_c0_seq1/m.7656 comp12618_c0_seq1/g.7656  ORF comp12618_c0_seq1/g.7656 comp12618_c0_seq1/m.7656 type:complete len:496 (-) comp12618_c0_seq1:456-1943(-)